MTREVQARTTYIKNVVIVIWKKKAKKGRETLERKMKICIGA
jgi:hypothetical protein